MKWRHANQISTTGTLWCYELRPREEGVFSPPVVLASAVIIISVANSSVKLTLQFRHFWSSCNVLQLQSEVAATCFIYHLNHLQRASVTIWSSCDVLQLYHLKQLQRASGSIWMLNHLQRAFSGSSVATWHKCRWLLTVGAAATCFRWFPKRPCWIIAIRGSCTKHSQTLRYCVVILTSLTAISFSWLGSKNWNKKVTCSLRHVVSFY